MPTPQITDYSEALCVFEDNDHEAQFESREETGEVILKIKRPGSRTWNITYSIQVSKLPDPADATACEKFWERIWHTYQIYPLHTPTYAIKSDALWIALRDRQPDNNQPVLAYGELLGTGRRPHVVIYAKSQNANYPSSFNYATHDMRIVSMTNVTHWLPIPEPPSRRF